MSTVRREDNRARDPQKYSTLSHLKFKHTASLSSDNLIKANADNLEISGDITSRVFALVRPALRISGEAI